MLPRGNWMDESGAVVQAGPAAVLAAARRSKDRALTRLDLARWIVSRDNPLTARVMVNRLWKQFFGIGLCRTLDDLGSQGEWPANPELLDWLACEFMDSGWDVKQMVRTIVTSQTYRQISTATAELLAARSGQPPVGPAKPFPPGRRAGARQRAGDLRAAGRQDRRPERQAVSARRAIGRT